MSKAGDQPKQSLRVGLVVALGVGTFLLIACCITGYLFCSDVPSGFLLDDTSFSTDDPGWTEHEIPRHLRILIGQPNLPCEPGSIRYWYTAGIDHVGILRCDMSPEDFQRTMRALGLTPWSEDREFSDDPSWMGLGSPGAFNLNWWTPPQQHQPDESLYVKQWASIWQTARHDGRTFWYRTISH